MSSADPRIGTTLGAYRIDATLGRGGMGVVYLAEHLRLKKRMALKVLPPELIGDEQFRRRFERESQMAAALDHPNIVPVHDAGEIDGVLYIAMQYVEGTDLAKVLASEGALVLDRTLSIVAQTADALDEAHALGLAHRDVKPANILLTRSRSGERAYLTDFGLAKQWASASRLTRSGLFVGTLSYAAPEQFTGGDIDGRADVYSLGCVLYECLTGRVPFDRAHEPAVMYAHLNDPPPAVTSRRPDLPAGLDDVVARAMAKDRDDRYPTCGEMVGAARAALGTVGGAAAERTDAPAVTRPAPGSATTASSRTVPVGAPAPIRPGEQAPRRRGAAVALGVAVAVVATAGLGVGGYLLLLQNGPPRRNEPDPPRARSQVPSSSIAVSATSILPPDVSSGLTYDPSNAVDGDLSTAWSEGVRGNGEGESLTFRFPEPVDLARIDIVNGYAKSPRLFQDNARVRDAVISTESGDLPVTLDDRTSTQRIEPPRGRTLFVRIRVGSVYRGSRFEDLAITEVAFWRFGGAPGGTPMPTLLTPASVTASTIAEEAVDACEQVVPYDPKRVADGDSETAWRTPGAAIGESITFTFAEPVVVTRVGLIPGYSKVDPCDQTDRFPQNRIIERVRWVFGDGTEADQSFEPFPEIQRINVTTEPTRTVTVEIADTTPHGGRDYTVISEIEVEGYPAP
jgi:serine/threonine protein kinase